MVHACNTDAADVIGIVKGEKEAMQNTTDHMPTQIHNTIAKVGDKAVLMLFQKKYIQEMIPPQLGVGVKYATELLAMDTRITLHRNEGLRHPQYGHLERVL